MADDLDDEWWTESKGSAGQDDQEADTGDEPVTEQPTTGAKRKLQDNVSDREPRKKKKKKKKTISDVLESQTFQPLTVSSFTDFLSNHLDESLSSVEKDEIQLTEDHFFNFNDSDLSAVSYLRLILPKWKTEKTSAKATGSPLLLVITSAATRAVQLNRDIAEFKGEKCKTAKLFAKHIKLTEQTKFLSKEIVHLGIGTPNRIRALLDRDALHLDQACCVLLDWSWRDAKLRKLVDIPEIRQELLQLLIKHVIPAVKSSHTKLALL